MRLKLSESWIRKLAKFPESGMGYQNVRVKFADGSFLNTVVLNGESLELPDSERYVQEIEAVTIR